METQSLTATRQTIGDLGCVIVDTPGCEKGLRAVVMLCHGFGAPGEDLVPCAAELFRSEPDRLQQIRFVFPAGPLELDMGGFYESRAWWPIDMAKLQQMIDSGDVRDMRQSRPELLDTRRDQIMSVIEQLREESELAPARFVLGGFSQGAMLATETALSLPDQVGGLIVWSGTLLGESTWREYAATKSGLKIVQSHGNQDPILPFVGAQWLRDLFAEFEMQNEFIEFAGPHTIPREGITLAAKLIADVAGA
ncbi:MAG: alpha/beta hydrolase [Pirellulaceae bacterium]